MANVLPFEYLTTRILAQPQSVAGIVYTDSLDFDSIRSPSCAFLVSLYSGSADVTLQLSTDDASWADSTLAWNHDGRLSVGSVIRNINYKYARLKIDGTCELTGVYSLSRDRRFPASLAEDWSVHIADAEAIDSPGDYVCGSTDGFPYCLPITLP